MAFVKLDCGILNSTLWVEREPRDVFITSLLMAVPFELTEPMPQLKVNSIEETGFVVPPGWYGFIEAAGPGIVRRAIADPVLGMDALARLGEPDMESRSSEFEGRRLVRVDGGYIVLNFMKYREKDNTSAIRQKRYRDRKKEANIPDPTARASRVTAEQSRRNSVDESDASRRRLSCGVTKAEAEAEAEEEEEIKETNHLTMVSPRPEEPEPAIAAMKPLQPKPKGPPDCPHLAVIALWGEVMSDMPQHLPNQWKGTRAIHLRARWRETAVEKGWTDEGEGLMYLRKFFAYCRQSRFLSGKVPPKQGHRQFELELSWLVNPANWAKVQEGKYHGES